MTLNVIKKIVGSGLIFMYFLIPVFLFQSMATMTTHHQMDMMDCPYMSDSQSVCPLDFSNYLNSWNIFIASNFINIKSIILYLSFIILVYLFNKTPLFLKLYFYFKKQRYRFLNNLYQYLFSRGILNPKTY